MKLACVVHRFGEEIAGGSEGHCRAVAERLAAHHDVTILTTTARDHVTWRNEYPVGRSEAGALHVHRFQVARQRSMQAFADISTRVFHGGASEALQEEWFRTNGPEAPDLLEHLKIHGASYDRILFWSFRYYQTFFGLPLVADRAVLLPTAEDDAAIRLDILAEFFTRPAGLVYLTPEEQALVERHSARPMPPSCVIGSGLDEPPAHHAEALAAAGVTTPYVLYVGRIDPNKGCGTLLRFFTRWATATGTAVPLVMAGPANMPSSRASTGETARLRGGVPAGGAARARVAARDAVTLRESEHGAARSVESRRAGAGERPLRCAARPGAAGGGRALLPELRRVLGQPPDVARSAGVGARSGTRGTRVRRSPLPMAGRHAHARGLSR